MARHMVGRGTLLNTATVAAGALLGLAAGQFIPEEYKFVAMTGIGLVTIGLGIKMLLQTSNFVLIAAALVLGGCLGVLLRIEPGLESFAAWAKSTFGGSNPGRFEEAVITTSILFCVGPMTLLGCMQDALEDKIDLLAIKSTMDGFSAIFFAAALGGGVLVTAGVVLVFQGALTLAARPLRRYATDVRLITEAGAAGGAMLVAIGIGLLGIKQLPVATFLPALVLAPLFLNLGDKIFGRRVPDKPAPRTP